MHRRAFCRVAAAGAGQLRLTIKAAAPNQAASRVARDEDRQGAHARERAAHEEEEIADGDAAAIAYPAMAHAATSADLRLNARSTTRVFDRSPGRTPAATRARTHARTPPRERAPGTPPASESAPNPDHPTWKVAR